MVINKELRIYRYTYPSCKTRAKAIFNNSMRLIVNGKHLEVENNITLLSLLEKEGVEVRPIGLAVAVNEEIVPKSKYAEYVLKEGDRVEIVNIVGGG